MIKNATNDPTDNVMTFNNKLQDLVWWWPWGKKKDDGKDKVIAKDEHTTVTKKHTDDSSDNAMVFDNKKLQNLNWFSNFFHWPWTKKPVDDGKDKVIAKDPHTTVIKKHTDDQTDNVMVFNNHKLQNLLFNIDSVALTNKKVDVTLKQDVKDAKKAKDAKDTKDDTPCKGKNCLAD